jgi:hypothetical protein
MEEINGSTGEIFADYQSGKVLARFTDPSTGEMAVELHLDPEVAREFALSLTSASIAVEEARK